MQVEIHVYLHVHMYSQEKREKERGRERERETEKRGETHLGGHNFDISDVASQLNHRLHLSNSRLN